MGYEKKPRLGGDRRWSRMVPIVYLDRKGFRVSPYAMSLKAGTHCAQDRRKFSRSVRQPNFP